MQHTIKLKPFLVPNFAIVETSARPREEGFQESPAIPLADLSADTLAAMCDQFRQDVFAKARKSDLPTGRRGYLGSE